MSDLRYRPEIDGLRAIAVLAVVLFHAGLGFPGGYVGVDVFFVISGYLITSLLVKDLDDGVFSSMKFWERRARRIIPALVVVMAATLAAGWFLLLPADYAGLGRSAASVALFVANIYFWRDSNYFASVADQKPLFHTWSLAVEEQFYVFAPIVLGLLWMYPGLRRRGNVLLLMAAVFVVSLASSVLLMPRHSIPVFYLLPTRAWELLTGCVLAFLVPPLSRLRGWPCELASIAGLAGILVPCFCYRPTTPFPGLAAVPPVLGTALFLWANTRDRIESSISLCGRLLSMKIPVFLGLISYSLYLWHWPLCAYVNYWSLGANPLPYRCLLVALAILLAALSWRYVERPFRMKRFRILRSATFKFSFAVLSLLFLSGWAVNLLDGIPQRLPAQLRSWREISDSAPRFTHESSIEEVRNGHLLSIGSTERGAPMEFVVWGDSHAMAVLPAIDSVLKQMRVTGRAATHSATAPLLRFCIDSPWNLGRDTPEYNAAVLAWIRKNKIPNVILAANWSGYENTLPLDGFNPRLLTYTEALFYTVTEIRAAGSRPWILLQVPNQPFNVPKALALAGVLGLDESRFGAEQSEWNGIAGNGTHMLDKLRQAGADIIDPRPLFLDPDTRLYRIAINGNPLYADAQHLTVLGAQLLAPLFQSALFPDLSPNAHGASTP